MNIDISTESAESLIRDMLVADYKSTKEEIKTLKSIKKDIGLFPYQEEDYENAKSLLKGFKRILSYYLTHEEYVALMNSDE